MSEAVDAAGLMGIAAVERDTGISKDSLRIWERRYGFPCPLRDEAGERAYPLEQVHKLRLIRRLLDLGFRAGRLAAAEVGELEAWLRQAASDAGRPPQAQAQDEQLRPYIEALHAHEIGRLRHMLARDLMKSGLWSAVTTVIAPLITRVGDMWMRGELRVFEEHLFSEAVQSVLRHAIQNAPRQRGAAPRVVLTTPEGESHMLGLLMVEALLVLEGADCLSLGAETPPDDIASAAAAYKADIVAISCSPSLAPALVQALLGALRERLPASVELWAGGSNAALLKRSPTPTLRHVPALTDIPAELDRWRSAEDHTAA